ncbi:hypothetical protein ACQ4PT_004288 [Festuca glaucescens]
MSYRLSDLSDAEVSDLRSRPRIDFSSIFSTVNPIVEDVRVRGDAAVKDYTEKFDKVVLDNVVVRVSDLPVAENSEAMVSIDMPAGPSELLVIAEKYANPVHVAADLLSQAEHGPDSQVVLVIAGDGVDLGAIEAEVSKQCDALPRGEFASKALGHSFTVFARDMVEAVSFSNMYAPEHLIINVKDAEQWEELIENAGSVFLGQWTPESVGDYASGTNHVLPTYGYARMYSGVSLNSFLKYITVQSLTEEGLRRLGPYVAKMAEVDGLEAHKRAVTLRLQEIEATGTV